MAVEAIALAALLAAYADSRYQVVKDLGMGRRSARAIFSALYEKYRDRVNVWYTFEYYVQDRPEKVFLRYPQPVQGKVAQDASLDSLFNVKEYTYKQANEIILKYASVFYHELGVRPGDRVAVDFVNKDSYVFVWLALWSLGAIPALINYNLVGNSFEHCVRAADAKALIADDEISPNIADVVEQLSKEGLTSSIHDDSFRSRVQAAAPFRLPDEQRPVPAFSDAACYIYTSGTTGLPKAAVMSWKKAFLGARLYGATIDLYESDVLYSAMPLYHSTAAVLGFLNVIHRGASFAIGHKFSTRTFWTQAKLTGATVIQYVGETGRYLMNAPKGPDERAHKVRMAIGNGLRPDVWVQFKDRFNVGIIDEFYGATEFPIVITNHQQGDFGVGSCGAYGSIITRLMQRTRYRLAAIDPDTQEIWRDEKTGLSRTPQNNEPGEMLFKLSPNDIEADFQGYTNKEANEEKLIRNVFAKGDVWMRSGDLLKRNADNQFFFVDRLGDTFRWKSENVSTNEVEEAFAGLDFVKQAVVVGVKVPNHEGRAGFAVLETDHEPAKIDGALLAKTLIGRLPRYAVPIFIKTVKAIETTGNNKVQKKLFRNQELPSKTETIFWLYKDSYVPLTEDHWQQLAGGSHKL